jgi:hypothetical protein
MLFMTRTTPSPHFPPYTIVVLTLLSGCGSSTPSSSVSAIGVSPDPCAVGRTDSVQMSAEATMPDGSKGDITTASGVSWSSGNTNVLTVDDKGVVVGVNPGVTSVKVAYQGATGSVDCTVGP